MDELFALGMGELEPEPQASKAKLQSMNDVFASDKSIRRLFGAIIAFVAP
jgi:hypothetical protein